MGRVYVGKSERLFLCFYVRFCLMRLNAMDVQGMVGVNYLFLVVCNGVYVKSQAERST